jgi:hypothetical protein
VLLGLGCILVAQVIGAVQFIVEEQLMGKMTPTVLVGFEGLWGLAYYVVLVPVLSLTPRSEEEGGSPYDTRCISEVCTGVTLLTPL